MELVKSVIDAVFIEEMMALHAQMEKYQKALGDDIFTLFSEEHLDSTVKTERFNDTYRAGWIEWKLTENKEICLSIFRDKMEIEEEEEEDT